ncbi:YczE/YyaS/YitT family protein [Kingella potus]|nr:hypothetical protein [Kingella potus]UOP01023.1 hypothetical protein LVJ84_01135 [Kingella potus]
MTLLAVSLGVFVQIVPPPQALWARVLLCAGGVAVMGAASALYLSCRLGAGPRDGLMVGLCMKTGWRVGIVRSLMEISVCGAGWLLGGTVGIGTLLFAFGVGWVVQWSLNLMERCFSPG